MKEIVTVERMNIPERPINHKTITDDLFTASITCTWFAYCIKPKQRTTMKKLTRLLLTLFTVLFSGTSIASHIQPTTPVTHPSNLTSVPNETSTAHLTNFTQNKKSPKTFNQELQWRILNLLVQQLFQSHQDSLNKLSTSNDTSGNNLFYSTNTFSVNISALKPDFYLIKIIDTQLGSNTELEIPKL